MLDLSTNLPKGFFWVARPTENSEHCAGLESYRHAPAFGDFARKSVFPAFVPKADGPLSAQKPT